MTVDFDGIRLPGREAADDGFSKILTANRLTDGAVVYLTRGMDWSCRIDDACVAWGEADEERFRAAGRRAVAAQRVVGPYLIDVEHRGRHVLPLRFRERVRAFGPTVSAGGQARAA